MTMNVLQELLIHFHSFRNVDLLNQGLYQIRTRIFYTENNKRCYAIPYYHTESKEIESVLQTDEVSIKPHNIIPSHINEESNEFIPKTFLIRYSDEEVELDEFCYFRIEHIQGQSELIISVEFELFFSDALNSLGKTSKNGQGATMIANNVEFKSVTTQLVLISSDSNNYVESYCPIVYAENFSSVLNISIHKLVIDYKLRINDIKPFAIEVESTNPNKKEKKDDLGIKATKEKRKITSLIQFLTMEDVSDKLDDSVIDRLYYKYVISLIHNYLTLKNKFTRLSNKLLEDKHKSEYSSLNFLPQLKIYKDERDSEDVSVGNEDNSYTFVHKISRLSSRMFTNSCDYIANRILLEITFISSQIYQLWHKYVELIRNFPVQTNYIMSCEYKKKLRNDLLKFVKKSIISVTDSTNLLLPIENNIPDNNKTYSIELRKSLTDALNDYHFENVCDQIRPTIFPVLFEETYLRQHVVETKKSFYENQNWEKESTSVFLNDSTDFIGKNPRLGLHLIVLVHGFQGNAYDMRLIKNAIGLENPSCVFLSSSSNQDDTEIDIFEMGRKLANEVKAYLQECSEGSMFNKISFIGHSIGGLIIRAALPHLEDLSPKLWIYMSLSSPHLGYIYSNNTLFNAGMWVLKQWKKSRSLEQLMLSDEKEMKDCCLFKLSDYEGLNWFNHVYLVSSHQDSYAPYESTRIQLCYKSLDDNHKGNIYRNMAYNILSKMTRDTLKRVDVNFYIAEKNLDSFIGRTAHIQFLENVDFMRILFSSMHDIL